MNLSAYIGGIGVLGPGSPTGTRQRPVLSGAKPYLPQGRYWRLRHSCAHRTPAAPRVVKLALTVALEASSRAKLDPAELASVFASSGGRRPQLHELCQALALAGREVSPDAIFEFGAQRGGRYWEHRNRSQARIECPVRVRRPVSRGSARKP